MKKYSFIFRKLVRDKIPDLLEKEGLKYYTKNIQQKQMLLFLKKKINEESYELLKSENPKDILEEIVDMMDIFYLILSSYNILLSHLNIESHNEQYIYAIKRNISTTTKEIWKVTNKKEAIENLSKLFSWIHCLLNKLNKSLSDIVVLSDKKKEERGGFEKKIILMSAIIPEDHPLFEKYKNSGYKYKELIDENTDVDLEVSEENIDLGINKNIIK